jgi:hypothetical protein
MGREDEIKLIAYKIWEEEGCVDGRDCEYWFRAEVIWEQQQKKKLSPRSPWRVPRKPLSKVPRLERQRRNHQKPNLSPSFYI